jgi:hypothetical protein
LRVRIFVDFWNFQIAWNRHHEARNNGRPKIPWDSKFPEVLVKHAGDGAIYAGTNVYVSFDPLNRKDAPFRRFLNAMDGFPGYRVTVKERKPRSPLKCNHDDCRKPLDTCPTCKRTVSRTVEKGIDTAIVTDLIQLAIDDMLDTAVLVTADADFIPAVEFIQNRTSKRIVHAHFRPEGQNLRNACWTHLFFDNLMAELI